jgi:hypothetical protein
MRAEMDPSQIGRPTAPRQVDPNSPYLKDFDQRSLSELSKLYQDGRIGEEFKLARKLARVAAARPEIRERIAALLAAASDNWREELDAFRLAAHNFPKQITASRWASMTNPEKMHLMRKLAHQALLKSLGLDKEAVRRGEAFMVYKIDPASNNSKFYEGLIVEDGDQGFRVFRRWGSLTDSGSTGRVDGAKFDEDPRYLFPTIAQAKRELSMHYNKRKEHGYLSAYGPEHRSPDGEALPQGQYPVGLTRKPGFGWGTQSVTRCIPALRTLEDDISQARDLIRRGMRPEDLQSHLTTALRTLTEVARADSTMAAKLKDLIGKALRRLQGGRRFLDDPIQGLLANDLLTIENYIRKQLSHCE